MRFRTTIVLGLLFAALLSYVYFVERRRAAEEASKEKLVQLDPDRVSAVTLIYPDRKIHLEKKDGEWRLTEPVDAPGDDVTIGNLVRAIADCEVKRTIEKPQEDLSVYGLDQPTVTVLVKLDDGTELPPIRVGRTTPVGFSAYVQRGENGDILLVGSIFHSGMKKEVKDLRDKRLLVFDLDEPREIGVRSEKGTVRLVREGDTWKIAEPRELPADQGTVRSFLSTLRSMRAVDFPDDSPEDLSKYGLDQPRLTVELLLGENKSKATVLMGDTKDKKVYAKRGESPVVYALNDWVFRDLDKGPGDFRDKTLLAFDPADVSRIEIAWKSGESLSLVRRDEKEWEVEGAAAGESARSSRIQQLLTDLKGLKGYEVASENTEDLVAFGLEPPEVRITLAGKEKPIGTILLGTYEGDEEETRYAGMREGGDVIFHLRQYMYRRGALEREDLVAKPTPTPSASPTAEASAA